MTGLTPVPPVGFPCLVGAGVVRAVSRLRLRGGVGAGVAMGSLGVDAWQGGGSEASGEKVGASASVGLSWRGGASGGKRNAADGRGKITLARPVLLLTAGGVAAAVVAVVAGVEGTAVGRGAGAAAERGVPRG